MSLQIIGPGFGRTGTKSLKEALEILGFGPCHHMYEVLDYHETQVPYWQAVARGETPVWSDVFDGYKSQVDWPGANVWRETMEAFPDAKVVLSVRPPEKWWASFEKTIGKLMDRYPNMDLPPHIVAILDMNMALIGNGVFDGKFRDKDAALAAFEKRKAEVQEAVPSDRLLVFDVAEGWEPLCNFLKVSLPDMPFPHHNLRADFWEVLGGEPD